MVDSVDNLSLRKAGDLLNLLYRELSVEIEGSSLSPLGFSRLFSLLSRYACHREVVLVVIVAVGLAVATVTVGKKNTMYFTGDKMSVTPVKSVVTGMGLTHRYLTG